MSKQVYFVVYYDTETKEVFIDEDTLVARFPKGSVWNTETEKWENEITIGQLHTATEKVKAGF